MTAIGDDDNSEIPKFNEQSYRLIREDVSMLAGEFRQAFNFLAKDDPGLEYRIRDSPHLGVISQGVDAGVTARIGNREIPDTKQRPVINSSGQLFIQTTLPQNYLGQGEILYEITMHCVIDDAEDLIQETFDLSQSDITLELQRFNAAFYVKIRREYNTLFPLEAGEKDPISDQIREFAGVAYDFENKLPAMVKAIGLAPLMKNEDYQTTGEGSELLIQRRDFRKITSFNYSQSQQRIFLDALEKVVKGRRVIPQS